MLVLAAAACGGCEPAAPSLYSRLQDESPSVRVDAIIEAAKQKDDKAIAYLVDRLTDKDRSVRLYAIMSLKKMTGQTMGYLHYDPPERRNGAVARWRHWLANRSKPAPETQQAQWKSQQESKGREYE